ncbi:MAG: GIY-YIG nuclease family protein [Patescibacteria group bacterium]
MHYVYIVSCADQTLYTGYTTDPARRVHEHNHARTGARYTKMRRPVELVYSETCITLSEALKREVMIKKMTKKEKQKLVQSSR